ncbi:unnamed protein product, partial [Amoebophrya sp. A25]|eukprot:GSA25T00019806001.1
MDAFGFASRQSQQCCSSSQKPSTGTRKQEEKRLATMSWHPSVEGGAVDLHQGRRDLQMEVHSTCALLGNYQQQLQVPSDTTMASSSPCFQDRPAQALGMQVEYLQQQEHDHAQSRVDELQQGRTTGGKIGIHQLVRISGHQAQHHDFHGVQQEQLLPSTRGLYTDFCPQAPSALGPQESDQDQLHLLREAAPPRLVRQDHDIALKKPHQLHMEPKGAPLLRQDDTSKLKHDQASYWSSGRSSRPGWCSSEAFCDSIFSRTKKIFMLADGRSNIGEQDEDLLHICSGAAARPAGEPRPRNIVPRWLIVAGVLVSSSLLVMELSRSSSASTTYNSPNDELVGVEDPTTVRVLRNEKASSSSKSKRRDEQDQLHQKDTRTRGRLLHELQQQPQHDDEESTTNDWWSSSSRTTPVYIRGAARSRHRHTKMLSPNKEQQQGSRTTQASRTTSTSSTISSTGTRKSQRRLRGRGQRDDPSEKAPPPKSRAKRLEKRSAGGSGLFQSSSRSGTVSPSKLRGSRATSKEEKASSKSVASTSTTTSRVLSRHSTTTTVLAVVRTTTTTVTSLQYYREEIEVEDVVAHQSTTRTSSRSATRTLMDQQHSSGPRRGRSTSTSRSRSINVTTFMEQRGSDDETNEDAPWCNCGGEGDDEEGEGQIIYLSTKGKG